MMLRKNDRGSRDRIVVRALDSHCCGLGSIPKLGLTGGFSLLLLLIPAINGVFPLGLSLYPPP